MAGQPSKKEALLIGREISQQWLQGRLSITRMDLAGEMRRAFADVLSAARDKKLWLPTASLRPALLCRLDNLVGIDRDLGVGRKSDRPAAEIYTPAEDDVAEVRRIFADALGRWVREFVEPWGQRHDLGDVVARLNGYVRAEDVELVPSERPYMAAGGRPEFALIARSLGQQLIGETLFDGLGGCELISSADAPGNSVELMTLPQRRAGSEESFSMVARLTVATVPYSKGVYLLVSAAKRVWARRPPTLVPSPVRRATGYVMAPGRPAAPASIILTRRDGKANWEFGDDYAALVMESGGRLAKTLTEAVAQRDFDPQAGWWAGVPELTTLYRHVSPRTVFEGDEAALLERVATLLDPIVSAKAPIPFQEVRSPKRGKPLQEMLRVSDFVAAGAVFGADEQAGEDEVDPDQVPDEEDAAERERRLELFREQNVRVLRQAYGDRLPTLWTFCDLQEEADIIARTVQILFGDAVQVRRDGLPVGAHGLRRDLDSADKKGKVRFEDRARRWAKAAEHMRAESGERHMLALICAPDVGFVTGAPGTKPQKVAEDEVNYFAGIHALSAAGANVHHVLPIDRDERDPTQNFLHRVQSAIMDVTLAHSGAVLDVSEFVCKHLPQGRIPKAIYGVQAVRSRARMRTGQSDANFLLYSRTLVDSGLTQARIACHTGRDEKLTGWMPLSEALAWVGSQRALCDSDARWLETAFKPVTRQCLSQIAQEDPHAIVLIDWASVQGLWKGIRDEDLGGEAPPSLDNIKLSAFGPQMTFVRLRRGDDTLALRTCVHAKFEGLREQDGTRSSIGEIRTDSYYTTEARIVEVAAAGDGEPGGKAAHFVGVPGYPRTVQVKRGLSCYRPRMRMSRLGKGLSEFGERVLEVSTTDAALPAPMDISVMACPSDVAPELYAVLAMGLRVGYAHYGDWTALPAPLFFRKKVDDYVIRYPEDADGDSSELSLPEPSGPEGEVEGSQLPGAEETRIPAYARMVAEEAQGLRPAVARELQPSHSFVPVSPAATADLLAMAQQTQVPECAYADDLRLRRIYQGMIRGDIRVRVALPAWVELRGLLATDFVPTKRLVRRCWQRMRDFQYVRASDRMPAAEDFLDWLAEKTRSPQACRAIVSVTEILGTVNFAGLLAAVHGRYNPLVPAEERVDTLITEQKAVEIARWCDQTDDDEIAAWLVFLTAQFPIPAYRTVLQELTHITGARTAHALAYYVESAAAIRELIELKPNERRPIVRELPPDLPALASAGAAPTESIREGASDLEPEQQATQAAAQAQDDPLMQVKSRVIELLQALQPGSAQFDAVLTAIREQLDTVAHMHAQRLEQLSAATEMANKLAAMRERQAQLLERLRAVDPSLAATQARELSEATMGEAETQMAECEQACVQVLEVVARLTQLEESPAPSGLLERKRRKDAEQELANRALEAVTRTRELIEGGCCFAVRAVDAPEECAPVEAPPADAVAVAAQPAGAVAEEAQGNGAAAAAAALVATVQARAAAQSEVPLVTDPGVAQPERNEGSVPAQAAPGPLAQQPWVLAPDTTIAVDAPGTRPGGPAPLPVGAPVAGAPQEPPAEQDNADVEVAGDESEMDSSVLEAQAGTLMKLMEHRLYGLAKVHLHGLGALVEGASEPLRIHHAVMAATVDALDAMDCQFSFEQKLPQVLTDMLAADRFPADEICDSAHLSMGVLAAGLPNMLFDSGETQWRLCNAVATRLVDRPAVLGLMEHLDLVRKRNYQLTRDLFLRSQVSDTNAVDKELARYRARAASWKDGPETFSAFNHRGFAAMHDQIFSPSHPIGNCVALIAKGEFAKLPAALDEAKRAFAKPAQTIEDDFKRRKERAKPVGLYRVRAVENIEKTDKFVHAVCELLQRRSSQNVQLTRDMHAFMVELHRRFEDAARELKAAPARDHLEQLYRNSACAAIECALRLFDPKLLPRCIADTSQRLLIQLPLDRDLLPALRPVDTATPALCAPADVFKETGQRAAEPPTIEQPDSEDDINKALVDAFKEHITAKRFLPAHMIDLLVPKAMLPKAPWLAQQHLRERDQLDAELQEARTRVAHAMTLNALSQGETNRMQLLIGELLMLCQHPEHPIGTLQVPSAAYPDFPQARAALRSNVLQPLEARFAETRAKLEQELAEEEARGLRAPADLQRIRAILGSGNAANLRTAHDALRMLRASGKLPAHTNYGDCEATVYEEVIAHVKAATRNNKQMLDALKDLLAAAPEPDDAKWLQPLDADQRRSAIELIDAWQRFFAARSGTQPTAERLFTLMGFSKPPQYYPEQARGGRARYMVDEQTFRWATAAEDPLFVPPVLGSWCTQILCFALFSEAQDSEIRQLIHETGETPTIVLARTHLSLQRRARIGSDVPVLLVDDDLIAYMALHPEVRLQTMVKVGMLTFRTNPYDDYNNKPVPSEMFFGRHQELTRLRDAKGMALLWGGRRLGKSSLLSQIERESREQGQEAVAVSMYTVSTGADFVCSAWTFIYRALAARQIVGSYTGPTNDANAIAHHVETQLMRPGAPKQLYLLIDEADDLMRLELGRRRDEPSFVRTLTQLTENVSHVCRVKIAIAGLHNMARMASDENTVFAKADPIALKPFTTPEDIQRGIRLVIKPLAAMGYSFGPEGEDLALRVLSVCNFYPALIQLYCRRLVEHLQNARLDKAPPYRIQARDLESIERDSALMSVLRDKFRYNLELDKRYKAIALILADEYYTATETGGYEGLTIPEVRERCEAYFPLHFSGSGSGVYEALLEEMSSLNIVEHMGARYVLRNPNIAMMIGDRDRVSALIHELSKEPPETSRNRGERRLPMTRGNSQVIFPMPTSWVRNQLNAVDAGGGELIVLTGNALSGVLDIGSAHVGREEWKLPDGFFQSAPVRTPQQLLDMVTTRRRTWSAARSEQNTVKAKITVVRDQGWSVPHIPEYLPIAEKAVKAGMRVVLLATPERALELVRAMESGQLRLNAEGPRSCRVVSVPAWSDDAIYYWNQENVPVAENQDALSAVRLASCGFGKEVMSLCRPDLTVEEALTAPQRARKTLAASREAFYQRIGLPPLLTAEHRKPMEDFLEIMDGMSRSNEADIEEARAEFHISEHMQQFLYWMGLLQEGPNNTWTLPQLYLELLQQKDAAK